MESRTRSEEATVPAEYRDKGKPKAPPLTAEHIVTTYGKRFPRPYDGKPGIMSSTLRARAAEGKIAVISVRLSSKKGTRELNVYAWEDVREIVKKAKRRARRR